MGITKRSTPVVVGLALLLCTLPACYSVDASHEQGEQGQDVVPGLVKQREASGRSSKALGGATSGKADTEPDSTVIDSTEENCPFDSKKGPITTRPDTSSSRPASVIVEPNKRNEPAGDEQLSGKADIIWRGDLNGDSRQDIAVEFENPCVRGQCATALLAGCGGNRFVEVHAPVPVHTLPPGYVNSLSREAREQAASFFTKHSVNAQQNGKWLNIVAEFGAGSNWTRYRYYKVYRFDKVKSKYEYIPGTAQYTRKYAQEFGMDPDEPPSCPAGNRPPIHIRSPEKGRALEGGIEIEMRPNPYNDEFMTSWQGHINDDGKTDLILGPPTMSCKDAEPRAFDVYVQCRDDWYTKVYSSRLISKIRVLPRKTPVQDTTGKYWRGLEMVSERTGTGRDTLRAEFNGAEYREKE